METYTLKEAADFLKIHPDTLRQRALQGIIPGAKIGKAWVFIADDLASYLRSQYSSPRIGERQGLNEEKEAICHSTNVEKPTGLNSFRQQATRYATLLGLPIKR